jgi:hypothetical protein
MTIPRLSLVALAGLGCLLWVGASAPPRTGPPPASSPKTLKILSEGALAVPAYLRAVDVRWAGDRRVYLGLAVDGMVEVDVDPAGSEPKEIFPGRSKAGTQWSSSYVAASARYLVAAGPAYSLGWRRKDAPETSTFTFDSIAAVDVQENRLAVVGLRRDEQNRFAPDGAIAWIGSLDRQLADLKPILYDAAGPGAPTMNRCAASWLAATRFLADGSLVVLPGAQPGIQIYDPAGKLLRTWDTARLGIDTDCATLTDEQAQRLTAHGTERQAWVNQRRTVDAILPLPQGIGFVVRRVEQERTKWDLKVLRPEGSIQTFAIPIEGSNGAFHLRADVRGGKLVFLLHEYFFKAVGRSEPYPSRLILAEAPAG